MLESYQSDLFQELNRFSFLIRVSCVIFACATTEKTNYAVNRLIALSYLFENVALNVRALSCLFENLAFLFSFITFSIIQNINENILLLKTAVFFCLTF